MQLLSALLFALTFATNIGKDAAEPFRFILEPGFQLTLGQPFELKYTILSPKYLQEPRRNPIGPKYDINPYSIIINIENMARPIQYVDRFIFYDEFWPVGHNQHNPNRKFVLPSTLPAGVYRFSASFSNLSKRKQEYKMAYSYEFKVSKGTEKRYDDLFFTYKPRGDVNVSNVSIMEQVWQDGKERLLYQIPTNEDKTEFKTVTIGEKSKVLAKA